MKLYYLNSLIGILEVGCENNKLISLKLANKAKKSDKKDDFIENIEKELDEYFKKERNSFDIKINPKGTNFQKTVWKKLLKIPHGKTKSYSEIAKEIGNKNAQRAVGSACNKNPIMIIIPCHRVISKSGKISGYAYGDYVKEKLLSLEN